MPAATLDAPPPIPDGVKAAMGGGGGGPFAGVGDMLSKQGGAPPKGGGPTGALKAQADAISKVLEQMVGAASAGKPFFSRAMKMIEQGVAAESQQGPGTPPAPQGGAGEGEEGPAGMSPPPAFPG
jgi:hypothetical protein